VYDLENLLNLNGEIFSMENGYWVKFEVRKVEPSKRVPHGIKYSLTLHDKRNRRVIGYDNAHSYKPSKKYGCHKETYDHIHKKLDVVPYEFQSASQLLEDFWISVEHYMECNG
jgi:hypothetical protein